MTHRIVAAPLALLALAGPALAQDDPRTVGISVEGTVVEVAVDLAAEACGIDAETLLADWEALGTELATMADTSAAADATDLAPEVAVDTPMDATIDGVSVADGADATHGADGTAAPDISSDLASESGAAGTAAVEGVEATAAETAPAGEPGVPADGTMDAGVETAAAGAGDTGSAGGDASASPATPTEGTALSKAAVCEVSRETADGLGIEVPG